MTLEVSGEEAAHWLPAEGDQNWPEGVNEPLPEPEEEPVEVRLERFRREHADGVTLSVGELEGWVQDLIRQGEDRERRRGRRGRDPEVFSAGEELNAVRYAEERGFITPLEAQKKVRKLLRLPGKRTPCGPASAEEEGMTSSFKVRMRTDKVRSTWTRSGATSLRQTRRR